MAFETLTSKGFVSPDRFRCARPGAVIFFRFEWMLNEPEALRHKAFSEILQHSR
jgi:hypothetical protein